MFSIFNFSSIFQGGGGQLTPFASICGRLWLYSSLTSYTNTVTTLVRQLQFGK